MSFIDSTGIALLLRMIDRCEQVPVPIAFRISPAISRLLEIIGLEGRIPLDGDAPPSG